MLQFLRDFREQIGTDIAASVCQGIIPPQDYIEKAALRCDIMRDIETIDADTINKFYATPEKEGKEDAPTPEAERTDS